MSLFLGLIAVAVLAGMFGAMLGLGGGIFLVPAMTLIFKFPIHFAIGTSIVAVVATSVSGSANYIKSGVTNIRLGLTLETLTTLGAVAGGLLATSLGKNALGTLFALILLYTAYSMLRRIRPGATPKRSAERAGASPPSASPPSAPPSPPAPTRAASAGKAGAGAPSFAERVLSGNFYDAAQQRQVTYQAGKMGAGMLAGLVGGIASGLLGIGGGIIKVPVMNVVMGVPLKAATATSTFMVGITAVASSFVYYSKGFVNPLLAVPVALGVFIGAQLGTRVARRAKTAVLTWIFVAVLLFTAGQMLWNSLLVR